jgi:predicted RNase H-like nuclease (RuvC/YqgF family)
MSQQNFKVGTYVETKNLNDISPRLAKALENLNLAVDKLSDKNFALENSNTEEIQNLNKKIVKLNDENVDLLFKIDDLKRKNLKLEDANKLVDEKITEMIKNYRDFLNKAS